MATPNKNDSPPTFRSQKLSSNSAFGVNSSSGLLPPAEKVHTTKVNPAVHHVEEEEEVSRISWNTSHDEGIPSTLGQVSVASDATRCNTDAKQGVTEAKTVAEDKSGGIQLTSQLTRNPDEERPVCHMRLNAPPDVEGVPNIHGQVPLAGNANTDTICQDSTSCNTDSEWQVQPAVEAVREAQTVTEDKSGAVQLRTVQVGEEDVSMSLSAPPHEEGATQATNPGFQGSTSCSSDAKWQVHRAAAAAAEAKTLAEQRSPGVQLTRYLMLFVLVAAALTVSLAVFFISRNSQVTTFETQFEDLALRLVEEFHANAKLRVQVMDLLSVGITSSAQTTQQDWPFVTIDDFDARATASRTILGSHFVGLYPYVTKDQRQDWETFTQDPDSFRWLNQSVDFAQFFLETHNRSHAYTREHQTPGTGYAVWNDTASSSIAHPTTRRDLLMQDDYQYYETNATYEGLYGSSPFLYRAANPEVEEEQGYDWVNEPADAPGPFYPTWQVSPVDSVTSLYSVNYNVLDPVLFVGSYVDSIPLVTTHGQAIFGGAFNVDHQGEINMDDDYDTRSVPAASLFYPVFQHPTNRDKVVAVLELDYEFGPYLEHALPSHTPALTTVLSNCDQTFTYDVTGETATFLAADDRHDPDYNHMSATAFMTDFSQASTGTFYNGAPINTEHCPWQLQVYATRDLEEEYVTSQPYYYLAATLGVFFFTVVVFGLYDCLVKRWHHRLRSTAARSHSIVTGLFPSTVHREHRQQRKQQQQSQESAQCDAAAPNKKAFSPHEAISSL